MSRELAKRPHKNPCGSCPYRTDAPSGLWHPEHYALLPEYDAPTAEQPPNLFMCHQDDGHLCAGWVGCHDMDESMSLRIALAAGEIEREEYEATIRYVSPVPLFRTGLEAFLHGMKEIANPGAKTIRVAEKLRKKRKDLIG